MKKMISLLLALTMLAALVVGCGNDQADGTPTEGTTTEAPVVGPETALELMETVWGLFAENEKFPCMGGDAENPVFDAPGAVTMGGEENPLWSLYVPEDQLANITEAATLMHAMNGNTFTGGAMKLADGVDVNAFAQTMRDTIMSTQWMCGFPERLVIINVGSYVVVAFGLDGINFPEDGAIITPFANHLQSAYTNAKVLFNEEIL